MKHWGENIENHSFQKIMIIIFVRDAFSSKNKNKAKQILAVTWFGPRYPTASLFLTPEICIWVKCRTNCPPPTAQDSAYHFSGFKCVFCKTLFGSVIRLKFNANSYSIWISWSSARDNSQNIKYTSKLACVMIFKTYGTTIYPAFP